MIRSIDNLLGKKKKQQQRAEQATVQAPEWTQEPLSESLGQNIRQLRSVYSNCADVVFHPFSISGKTNACLVYIEGLVDTELLDGDVISPLLDLPDNDDPIHDQVRKRIAISKINRLATIADCIEAIAGGNAVLLHERDGQGLSLGLTKFQMRSIEEPGAEQVIRGPREGFIESLQVNTAMIRRKIKSPALKMESMTAGKYTNTEIYLCYIDGLAKPELVSNIKDRLEAIDIDGVMESANIEELIEEVPFSPFPQILSTERPDTVSASLLEGRVVILTDGTPFALILPVTFFSFLQAPDDYYDRFIVRSLIRLLRIFFFGVSLVFPALYVAITTYHQEMIPEVLLLTLSIARETIPFPALIEVLLMEIMIEALREAGVRLPSQLGSAVSIVGALVIGQAAVQAGIVSAPMLIVVATTGIASFLFPRYSAGYTIRMLRFPLIFLAGTIGILGIMLGLLAMVVHLCGLKTFGVPYLSPVTPLNKAGLKDTVWRAPLWMLDTRPQTPESLNKVRQAPDQKPRS